MRPAFLAGLMAGLCALPSAPAPAQGYPSKAVKIIVGTSPGGSPDVFARLIAQKMSESWGSVVIENRIGANGNIAAEMVSKSAPDGYTAYVCDSAIWAINPHLYAKVPYRPLADFAGITTIATLPTFLTVHPSVPATTYAEFIAYAKQNPGKLSYASAGNGSIHHITTELFKSLAGISMVHVPYKGMGQAGPALIAGEVQVAFSSYTAIAQFVKAGKVRILASAEGKRTPVLPDVPTIAELGIPGFDMASMLGALVPAGVPRDIIAKLNAGIVAAVASPEVNARISGFGVGVGTSTPEQFDALMRRIRRRGRHEHAGAVRRADARRIREVRAAGEALRREVGLTTPPASPAPLLFKEGKSPLFSPPHRGGVARSAGVVYPMCLRRNSSERVRASFALSASYDPRWSQLKPCPAL